MIVPVILLLSSFGSAIASVWRYGAVDSNPLLLSAICAFAAGILTLFAYQPRKPQYIVVDGSNVLHWDNEKQAIETVHQVLGALIEKGYVPLVWFDANVGYKIGDRYLGPYPLSQMLNIPVRQVFVAPKGTPADPLLLDGANLMKALVVTNDRFRDWAKSFPKIKEDGFLVKGHVRRGEVVLNFVS